MESMKAMNIKIPLKIVRELSDNGQLNSSYITGFIIRHYENTVVVKDKPIDDLTYNYTFKANVVLHNIIKKRASEVGLPMNDMLGRLLNYYYEGE